MAKDHPDLCSFVQVNFALSRKVKFWHGGDSYGNYDTDKLLGMTKHWRNTLGLDVSGLISLLTLPRQLRRDNLYNLKLVRFIQAKDVKTVPVTEEISDGLDMAWTKVASGNFGLDLTWRPPEKTTWSETFIRNTLTTANVFVPVAGPFLQIAFSVGWTLISEDDPQAAFTLLKNLCPGLDLYEHIIQELIRSAKETRQFLPEGWEALNLKTEKTAVDELQYPPRPIEDMDKGLPMLMQKEVLDATGNSPDVEKSKDLSMIRERRCVWMRLLRMRRKAREL